MSTFTRKCHAPDPRFARRSMTQTAYRVLYEIGDKLHDVTIVPDIKEGERPVDAILRKLGLNPNHFIVVRANPA